MTDDRMKTVEAEISLRHVQDTARLIDALGSVGRQIVEPIRERGRLNHFEQEHAELLKHKGR